MIFIISGKIKLTIMVKTNVITTIAKINETVLIKPFANFFPFLVLNFDNFSSKNPIGKFKINAIAAPTTKGLIIFNIVLIISPTTEILSTIRYPNKAINIILAHFFISCFS